MKQVIQGVDIEIKNVSQKDFLELFANEELANRMHSFIQAIKNCRSLFDIPAVWNTHIDIITKYIELRNVLGFSRPQSDDIDIALHHTLFQYVFDQSEYFCYFDKNEYEKWFFICEYQKLSAERYRFELLIT